MRVPRDESTDEIFLNLTAFIDMMLVLVIFFLATARFQEEERDESIRLAKSKSTMPIATVSDTFVINIDKDGRPIVDGRALSLEELEEIVRTRKAQKEDSEVVLRADVRALIGSLSEVHALCARLGFKTANFAYQMPGE